MPEQIHRIVGYHESGAQTMHLGPPARLIFLYRRCRWIEDVRFRADQKLLQPGFDIEPIRNLIWNAYALESNGTTDVFPGPSSTGKRCASAGLP